MAAQALRRAARILAAAAFAALSTGPLPAAAQPASAPAGAAAWAQLQGLERDLLAGTSATALLARWCADHRLADPPRILALRDRDAIAPASADVRRRLHAAPGEAIAYRRVRLACGPAVLSEADNWYLPGRLTPQMNAVLEATDTPFGQAVKALDFHRITLGAQLLWRAPSAAAAPAPPPADVLRIEAVLVAGPGAGAPFALVRETYRRDLFAAPPALPGA